MREVNAVESAEENKDQIEAIKMISRGLDALSKVNAEMAMHFRDAVEAFPQPEKLDLTPLLKAMEPQKPTAYVFNIQRDSTGKMSKIEAFPK